MLRRRDTALFPNVSECNGSAADELLPGAVNSDDDADDDAANLQFPNAEELARLPANMREALMAVVYRTMERALLPRLEFLTARRRRAAEEQVLAKLTPPVTTAALASHPLFSKWTNLDQAVRRFRIKVLAPRQALHFEHERLDTVWLLVAGAVELRKKGGGGGTMPASSTLGESMGGGTASNVNLNSTVASSTPFPSATPSNVALQPLPVRSRVTSYFSPEALTGSWEAPNFPEAAAGGSSHPNTTSNVPVVPFKHQQPLSTLKGFSDSVTHRVGLLDASSPVAPNPTASGGSTPPPIWLNGLTFFTEAPAAETVRCVQRAILWGITRHDYLELLKSQPPEVQRAINHMGLEARRDVLPRICPMSAAVLQSLPIFAGVPYGVLQQLVPKLQPRVFASGEALCTVGTIASEAVIVVRGQVRVTMHSSPDRLESPTKIWGDVSSLFVKKSMMSVTAESTFCDAFSLSREAMVPILTAGGVITDVLHAAHHIEASLEAEVHAKFLPMVRNIPFLLEAFSRGYQQQHPRTASNSNHNSGEKANAAAIADEAANTAAAAERACAALLEAFTTCVYPAHQCITSSSEPCNRIIIPVRGRAKVAAARCDLELGEAIGYLCLVPHRWRYFIAAVEPVQTLELPRDAFAAALQDAGALACYERFTRGLLHPKTYPELFTASVVYLNTSVNPPMFTPSNQAVEASLEPRVLGMREVAAVTRRQTSQTRQRFAKHAVTANDGLRPPPVVVHTGGAATTMVDVQQTAASAGSPSSLSPSPWDALVLPTDADTTGIGRQTPPPARRGDGGVNRRGRTPSEQLRRKLLTSPAVRRLTLHEIRRERLASVAATGASGGSAGCGDDARATLHTAADTPMPPLFDSYASRMPPSDVDCQTDAPSFTKRIRTLYLAMAAENDECM